MRERETNSRAVRFPSRWCRNPRLHAPAPVPRARRATLKTRIRRTVGPKNTKTVLCLKVTVECMGPSAHVNLGYFFLDGAYSFGGVHKCTHIDSGGCREPTANLGPN